MYAQVTHLQKLLVTSLTNPTNKLQVVTPKVLAIDVIAILGTEPARLPVLQVGGHDR